MSREEFDAVFVGYTLVVRQRLKGGRKEEIK